MALKDLLLVKLISAPRRAFSGEELAKEYNVSRAAVWKAVKALQNDGYGIQSSPRGYWLPMEKDELDSDLIRMAAADCRAPVYVFDSIDSTNNYAKILAAKGTPHGTLVCANHQTAGRGRQGHSFWSPKDLGLYFSLIIHPMDTDHISRITPAAAVAAVAAIEETAGIRPGIKWVNDLFVEKKKIAGILSEAVTDFETGKVNTVVIGIGINCHPMQFPEELEGIAGSLSEEVLSRSVLAGRLWHNLLYWCEHLGDPELMELYRRDSVVMNRKIIYHRDNVPYEGTVTAINDEGNLIVENPDGSTSLLHSGEISIKEW
ncbi:MAG: biotin--[acetyl-CoA-carboxylase] ligase [Erysipelotrichaceae bacterium]|nr:biotin--[acetyl-CoA-carboxylase] ligase [Erysipelotrichaceae bacterium]